jgi:tRNA A37 threonylcarbamoyladenosine dehydratase
VVDAIDTVSSKLLLVELANRAGTPIISCMGTGNKLHPEMLEISDIQKTSVCPLCRVMRRELKKRGMEHLTVVYSKEEPMKVVADTEHGRHAPGSISFVPPAAGYLLASKVIRDLTGK